MPRPPADPRPTRPGSISLLTEETRARFVANLRTGVPIPVAAQGAGVAPNTATQWMMIGRKAAAKQERDEQLSDHEEHCLALTREVEEAFQGVHLLLAGRVVQASEKDWRAATWMLQRRHPEAWNRTEQVEVSGPGGRPIEIAAVLERAEERLAVVDVESNGHKALGE